VVTTRNRSCAASANKALPAISPALVGAFDKPRARAKAVQRAEHRRAHFVVARLVDASKRGDDGSFKTRRRYLAADADVRRGVEH
jgi:hypothetical protein